MLHDSDIRSEVFIDSSRQWFTKVDRSLPGSFATTSVPDEVMIIDHARQMMRMMLSDMKIRARDCDGWADMRRRYNAYSGGTRPCGYIGELYFWIVTTAENKHMMDFGYQRIALSPRVGFGYYDRVDELTKVRDFPQYRHFYEAGVWDNAFIDGCIVEDINPTMARALVSA